jgi:hypothetical protein
VYLEHFQKVTPRIRKCDSVIRRDITPQERLSVTTRSLATGRCYEDLKFSAAISSQAFGVIIPETRAAIYEVLKKDNLEVS